jgi:hypothetical protein
MLHDLPDLPTPTAQAWDLIERQQWHDVRPLLHPYVRFEDRELALRGRNRVLDHFRGHPAVRPPVTVEIRDGQLYRWVR